MRSGFSSSSKRIVFLLLSVGCLASCSPELVSRKFAEPRQDFGPSRTDGDLPVEEIKTNAIPTVTSIRWKGDIETVAWYRASDDLGWIARKTGVPEIGKFAYAMHLAARRAAWESPFQNTAFVSAAIGETRDDTKRAVTAGVEMLKAQDPIIEKLLANRSAKHEWPQGRESLVAVVDQVDSFLKEFVRDVERSAVDPAVKKEIVEELRINFGPRIQRIKAQIALAYNESKTDEFVNHVRRVLKDEGVDLGSEIEAKLDLAVRLPREVEKISDSRTALSVLIDFWQAASVETRETKFKTMAPDLYDFLNGRDDEDLNCIKTGCGPITTLKRVMFILPAIEKYGPEKIKKQLGDAAEESIKSELETEASKFLPSLYKEVYSKISAELARQRGNISKIATDYATYLRLVLNRVAVAKLGVKEKDPLAGPEPTTMRVDLDFSLSSAISAQRVIRQNRPSFETGAGAIGAAMATAIELHDHHIETALVQTGLSSTRIRQALGRTFFEQINQVLMIGGFTTETAKNFDAFAVAVDAPNSLPPKTPLRFNLRTLLSSEVTYAVPDSLTLTVPARPELIIGSTIPKVISVSVAGQAELLKGLCRMAASLKDWEVTRYDDVLGSANLADFLPDLPHDSVDRKIFPKDLFYAASIGNAGALLQNMTKRSTTVGLIEPGGGMHWANEVDPSQDPTKQAIMATIFDLVNGVRSKNAKTVDVARYLSAIADFLRASDGIEKAHAGVLIDPGADGRRAVDQVVNARRELKLLVMALANYLSSETVGPDGVVLPIFTRSDDNHALGMTGEPRLIDQAVTIRALLDASEVIAAGIYRTAALDLMSATNAKFFRPKLAFYSDVANGDAPLSLEALANIIVAGERLSPFMKPERAQQWSRVARPWINALRDASETLP